MNQLQTILRTHLERLPELPIHKRVALKHIVTCKTAECGIIHRQCDHCEKQTTQYKSCGSRYCNQCGHLRKSLWVDQRLHESLNVAYFFNTFTIPDRLHPIFLYNERLCYSTLFKAASDAMKAAMKGEYGEGIKVGFMSVLHTHNQQLGYHPHIHMLIPAGGVSEDDMEWVPAKKNFLVKESILKRLFRVKLAQALKQDFEKDRIKLPPSLSFPDADTFFRFVYGKEKQWNVNIDNCGHHSENVIHYLGRYVNKTAISDERIATVDAHHVSIHVKNRETQKNERVSIGIQEFIRRFLLHILPKGMGRIRYFGFLSCRFKSKMLALLEGLLGPQGQHLSPRTLMQSLKLTLLQRMIKLGPPCEACHSGHQKLTHVSSGIAGEVIQHLFGKRSGIP